MNSAVHYRATISWASLKTLKNKLPASCKTNYRNKFDRKLDVLSVFINKLRVYLIQWHVRLLISYHTMFYVFRNRSTSIFGPICVLAWQCIARAAANVWDARILYGSSDSVPAFLHTLVSFSWAAVCLSPYVQVLCCPFAGLHCWLSLHTCIIIISGHGICYAVPLNVPPRVVCHVSISFFIVSHHHHHHHQVPSSSGRLAVMTLHCSWSLASLTRSSYRIPIHSVIFVVHSVLGLPQYVLIPIVRSNDGFLWSAAAQPWNARLAIERDPGFESPLLPFRSLGIFIFSTILHKWVPVGGGGNVSE